jgi:hypothetical protein
MTREDEMRWIIVASLTFLCLLGGCSKDEGGTFGPYYQFNFADSVSAVVAGDSIHVIVIEAPVASWYLQAIPFEITDSAAMLDTVKLKLTVLYGGYSPAPSPTRNVEVQGDSFILKYDRTAFFRGLGKAVGINGVETTPLPTYYSIRYVDILTSPNRHITFESRLVH